MFLPLLLLVLSKVSLECFLTPRTVDWVGDRCEGGYGLVFPGVLEELIQELVLCPIMSKNVPTSVRAPWPPMLCPVMLTLLESSSLNEEKRASGSSFVMYVYMLYPFVHGSFVASM